ncbi:MAG: Gfo/Idh/MocA family protein [Phycisphaeraceae bacterium]
MKQALRVGMVGLGGFGKHRRETMRQAGYFDLVACCDRAPEVLEEVSRAEGATPYDDFDAMLAHDGLEAVVISTGADTHAPFALRAMAAGLHVFIEKPVCTCVEEGEKLREAERRTGCIIGIGHTAIEGDALARAYQPLAQQGAFGTVVCYEENSSHSGGLMIRPGDWRGAADRNPGGMLFQCGVHALHRLVQLFGPIQSVQAMMRYDAHPATETADVANVLIRHENGMLGTLNCYHITGYVHEARVFGTIGNLYVETMGAGAWFQHRQRGEPEPREPIALPEAPPEAPYLNVLNWYRAIREGGSARPSLEDGLQALFPVFAAERAAVERREVALSELIPPAPARSA